MMFRWIFVDLVCVDTQSQLGLLLQGLKIHMAELLPPLAPLGVFDTEAPSRPTCLHALALRHLHSYSYHHMSQSC
jgi:hypothetical protein